MSPQGTETYAIIVALLAMSADIEGTLREEWPAVRDDLCVLAARVDHADAADALRIELDDLLARLVAGPAAKEVRRLLARTAGADPQRYHSPVVATPSFQQRKPNQASGSPQSTELLTRHLLQLQ